MNSLDQVNVNSSTGTFSAVFNSYWTARWQVEPWRYQKDYKGLKFHSIFQMLIGL